MKCWGRVWGAPCERLLVRGTVGVDCEADAEDLGGA
jgi:hypothetical protein